MVTEQVEYMQTIADSDDDEEGTAILYIYYTVH